MATRSSIGPATPVILGIVVLLIGIDELLGAWIWIGWLVAVALLVDAGCRWLASVPNDGRHDLPQDSKPKADWFWNPNRPANGPLFTIVDEDEEIK
jgi:hypothetical protein